MTQQLTKAWYKQFWPWFLIALPGSVVIASIATIIIASHEPDSIVVDDYYKAGLAINRNLSQERRAEILDIKGTLQLTNDRRQVRLEISTLEPNKPTGLLLRLLHPTQADKDQHITMTQSGPSTYHGQVQPIANGDWIVIVSPTASSWRIQRRIHLNDNSSQYRLR